MQIKKVIDEHGKSWASVAKDLGKTSSAIIQIADGNPTVGKLKQLAGVIGCHWLDFFQDELEAEGLQLIKKEQQPAATEPSPSSPQQPAEGGQQEADNLPFKPDEPAEKQEAQQAETVKAVRFQYQCPACGRQIKVCISEL